jgi:hypothetical protein
MYLWAESVSNFIKVLADIEESTKACFDTEWTAYILLDIGKLPIKDPLKIIEAFRFAGEKDEVPKHLLDKLQQAEKEKHDIESTLEDEMITDEIKKRIDVKFWNRIDSSYHEAERFLEKWEDFKPYVKISKNPRLVAGGDYGLIENKMNKMSNVKTFHDYLNEAVSEKINLYPLKDAEEKKKMGITTKEDALFFEVEDMKIPAWIEPTGKMIIFGLRSEDDTKRLKDFLEKSKIDHEKSWTGNFVIEDWEKYFESSLKESADMLPSFEVLIGLSIAMGALDLAQAAIGRDSIILDVAKLLKQKIGEKINSRGKDAQKVIDQYKNDPKVKEIIEDGEDEIEKKS